MIAIPEETSTFGKMVDKLRLMDEAELKPAYIRLFKEDLANKWQDVSSEANFNDTTEEEIIKVIQEARYSNDHS
jgi:hypothetical protein